MDTTIVRAGLLIFFWRLLPWHLRSDLSLLHMAYVRYLRGKRDIDKNLTAEYMGRVHEEWRAWRTRKRNPRFLDATRLYYQGFRLSASIERVSRNNDPGPFKVSTIGIFHNTTHDPANAKLLLSWSESKDGGPLSLATVAATLNETWVDEILSLVLWEKIYWLNILSEYDIWDRYGAPEMSWLGNTLSNDRQQIDRIISDYHKR